MLHEEQFTSKKVAIRLHELRFAKPSLFYYEWIGSDLIEEFVRPCWYEDGINLYTANQMVRELPKNVAINKNVKEFGFELNDNLATKRAKVLIYLLEKKILKNRFLMTTYE